MDDENRATKDEFYNLSDLSQGLKRKLASGLSSRIFVGDNSMLSIVSFEPNSKSAVHCHAEEQWGVLLEGEGIREQDGIEFKVRAGDFWRTPGGVPHGFTAGPAGARILDIFSPPREAYRKQAPAPADHG